MGRPEFFKKIQLNSFVTKRKGCILRPFDFIVISLNKEVHWLENCPVVLFSLCRLGTWITWSQPAGPPHFLCISTSIRLRRDKKLIWHHPSCGSCRKYEGTDFGNKRTDSSGHVLRSDRPYADQSLGSDNLPNLFTHPPKRALRFTLFRYWTNVWTIWMRLLKSWEAV